MKLSISNIAWEKENDKEMYAFLAKIGIDGIEIAPTHIFPAAPYDRAREAELYAKWLKECYGLEISSMQSIWYGRAEEIFEDKKQRKILLEYTKKAFEFAHAIKCKNLVFGCPKNRNMKSEDDWKIAEEFFGQLGKMAQNEEVVLALEPNPVIYKTNFINSTKDAYELVRRLDMAGIKINYDLGTVISNGEEISDISRYIEEIHHIHVSEPMLMPIKFEDVHTRLFRILHSLDYKNYVSIEMKNIDDIRKVQNIAEQFKEKVNYVYKV